MIKNILILILIFIIFIILKNKNQKEFYKNNNYNLWFNNNIDLYYINLPNSKKRNQNMIRQLKNLKIKFNRFNAYNGKLIDKKFKNILIDNFNTIDYNGYIFNKKKGSLGNYISQLTCWYKFYLYSQKKYLMIMEDDILLSDDFNTNVIYNYINLLENEDWVMLKFFCFNKKIGATFKNKLIKTTSNKYNYKSKPNTGMQCYIINKKNILKLIKDMLPINNDTFDWKNKYLMNRHNIYITKKNYLKTPDHDYQSDRRNIDNV